MLKIIIHALTRNLLQAMILHDQLEKRRLERSTSENGADIRRPMISSLHHTSITPPGWVKPLATMISGSITRFACFPSKQMSASLGVCHWYCDTNCHGSLHIYIRILACVHVHYRGWQSPFYSHLESTHLTSQSQQIPPAQQSVHPLQTATGTAAMVNGDDKRLFNHIQTYR